MAVLTTGQLAELRRGLAKNIPAVVWTKAQLNTAIQATEDWVEANKASYGAAVEAAVPGVFNAAAKKAIFAQYMVQKAIREGAV